jgi:F0F1-type ATP synthase epsilon subunit
MKIQKSFANMSSPEYQSAVLQVKMGVPADLAIANVRKGVLNLTPAYTGTAWNIKSGMGQPAIPNTWWRSGSTASGHRNLTITGAQIEKKRITESIVAQEMADNPNSEAWMTVLPASATIGTIIPFWFPLEGPITNYGDGLGRLIRVSQKSVASFPYYNAQVELYGKPWLADRATQDKIASDLSEAIAVAKKSVVDYLIHGGPQPTKDPFEKIASLNKAIAVATPDPEKDTSTWMQIAKGVLTVAATMVSVVATAGAALPAIAAGTATSAKKEEQAAAAQSSAVNQATEDLMVLKEEQAAVEQQAAQALLPDTFVLMVEQTNLGTFGTLEDAAAATITMTSPGDRFEVLRNGVSLGIRIRTNEGSVEVPVDVGAKIYSIARDQMSQFVGQAQAEVAAVAASSNVPWWMILGGGAAAAIASRFL